MSLDKIKNSFIEQKIQIIEIDNLTTVLATDNTICTFTKGALLSDINPFFYSLQSLLDTDFKGIKYPCVNLTIENKDYIFDIEVLKKETYIYVLFVDFTDHYTDSHPLVQEKNEAEIEKHKPTFERELLHAKEEFKNTFLSHLNHEVRNPLNNLLGFVDILMDTNLDFQQKEYVNVINKTGQHIKVLMDDLLDISRIETGALEIKNIPFNLIQSVVNITKHFQTKYTSSNVELTYTIEKKCASKTFWRPDQVKPNFIQFV
ncbi:MAG: sensor histidine kinase [Patiriisocius sp.]|uniref:sensor histidine kinase n=1 Tax=Patiriisocius sp. TaxID=2822396 RepID=UPI003EF71585